MSDTNTNAAPASGVDESAVAVVEESSLATIKKFGWAIFIAVAVAVSDQLNKIAPSLADFLTTLLPAWLIWAAPYIKMALLAVAAWLGKLGKDLHVESVDKAKELNTASADSPKKYY